ncbi:hypothetical protein [Undibacterium sp. TJN19]|uniref:hypothetical protein n=1 Tax=Undibacterium sp. TJN19 TaxID=3413055 RepID=UPI003BEF9072
MSSQENLLIRWIAWGLLCLNFFLYLLNTNAIDGRFYADLFLYIGVLAIVFPIGFKGTKFLNLYSGYIVMTGVISFLLSVAIRLF